MNNQVVFPLCEDPNHIICPLNSDEHTRLLQELLEKCDDYVMLVDGHGVSSNAAEELFQEGPPGLPLSNKFVYGIFNRDDALIGVLEGMRNYPEENTWWIGLLLINPEARHNGLGYRVVQSFRDYVRSQQGKAIMLGVIDENNAAFRFWERLEFEVVRQTEPKQFDKKTHSVYVMRLNL